MSATADVLIIGAGAYGLAAAWSIARRAPGIRIVVLDGHGFGDNQTGRCGAGIRMQWGASGNVSICRDSLPFFEEIAARLDYPPGIDLKQDGYLILAHTEGALAQLGANVELQRRLGVASEMIGPEDVARLAPGLDRDGILGASFCARDGSASPFALLDAYRRALLREGVGLRFGVAVEALEPLAGGGFAVRSSAGEHHAGQVLLCTDTRIPELVAPLGIDLPIRSMTHEALVTEPAAPLLGPCVVSFRDGLFVNQTRGGRFVVVVAHPREAPGDPYTPSRDLLGSAARGLVRLLPAIGGVRVLRAWSGLYALTPDMQPIIGASGLPGLFVGCSATKGFMSAPAAGEVMADYLLEGATGADWARRLTAGRFAGGGLEREPAVI